MNLIVFPLATVLCLGGACALAGEPPPKPDKSAIVDAATKKVAGQLPLQASALKDAQALGKDLQGLANLKQADLKAAATDALAGTAKNKISQAIPIAQQPLVGDVLTMGLKLKLPADAASANSFAPPTNSALPIGTQGLRSGVSLLTTSDGKVGLGAKSEKKFGSQKLEFSGALDPNSGSEQGKSAGVQIKIGGD